jgi:hypothetical protein
VNVNAVSVPTEVKLSKSKAGKTSCIDINAGMRERLCGVVSDQTLLLAGGDLTCITAKRQDGEASVLYDILMCGNGQFGGLGNSVVCARTLGRLRHCV